MNRQEIIEKSINVETIISTLVTHHFFPSAGIGNFEFLHTVMYDQHANTAFKISVFEKCYRNTPKAVLEAMRRLFAIRNIFAHCGLQISSAVDPELSGVVDPKDRDKILDFDDLKKQFVEKEKLCMGHLIAQMKELGLAFEPE